MDTLSDLHDDLDDIEATLQRRPGEALDDLETLIEDAEATIPDALSQSRRLLRNEDFSGAAGEASRTALLVQRIATATLDIREETRRRR